MGFWQTIRESIGAHPASATTGLSDPCFWRVDMHSHLVPDVDDGVRTLDQSLKCLQQLSAWGIQRVITTPHISRDWFPNSSVLLRGHQTTLQELADQHELPIRIDVAAEYMLDEFFTALLATGDLLTFGPMRYLLVELGWAAAPQQLDDLFFRLRTHGYTPVLAHPERYVFYFDDLTALTHLRQTDCLFQLNWGSLTGRYGEQVQAQARLLLKKGWVDFIGSDMHRPADLISLGSLFGSAEYEQLKRLPLRNESLLWSDSADY